MNVLPVSVKVSSHKVFPSEQLLSQPKLAFEQDLWQMSKTAFCFIWISVYPETPKKSSWPFTSTMGPLKHLRIKDLEARLGDEEEEDEIHKMKMLTLRTLLLVL